MRYIFGITFFTLIFFSNISLASTPKKELSAAMGELYEKISNANSWKEYLTNNTSHFPEISENSPKVSVVVIKEDFNVDGSSYTVGTSFRQLVVKASLERVKTLLSRPDLFQIMYELDKPSAADSNLQPGDALPESFEANVLKKLPSVLPDQEYTLGYKAKQDGPFWFQRVTQVEDKNDFALRETLVIVESTPHGTVFREIGRLYPMQWLIRAMGPQLRSITKTELEKSSQSFICISESNEPITRTLAESCTKKK